MPDFNFDAPKDMKNLFADTAKAAKELKETSEKAGVTPKFDFSNVKLNGFNDKFVDSLEFNDVVYNYTQFDEPDFPDREFEEPDEPINPPSPNEPEQVDLSDLFGQLKSMMNHIRSNYNTIVNTIVSAATGNAATSGTGNTSEPDETEQAESTFTNAQLQGRNRLAQKYVADTLADIKSELLAQGYNAAKLDKAVAFLTELYGYRISNAISEGGGLTIKKNDMKNYILNYFRTDWYSQGNDDVHDLQVIDNAINTSTQQGGNNVSFNDLVSARKYATSLLTMDLNAIKSTFENSLSDSDIVSTICYNMAAEYTEFLSNAKANTSSQIQGVKIEYKNGKYIVSVDFKELMKRFKALYMTHATSSSNTTSSSRNRGGSGTGSGTRTGNSNGRTRTGSSTGSRGSSPTRTRSSSNTGSTTGNEGNAPTRSERSNTNTSGTNFSGIGKYTEFDNDSLASELNLNDLA